MKKLNAKLALSAVLAVAMASASAMSVGAANYSTGGAVPFTGELPTSGGSSAGAATSTTPAASTPAADTSDDVVGVVTDATIESIIASAIANGEDIVIPVAEDSTGKLVIKKDLIALIKSSGITVTLEVTSADNFTYYITIDPATIDKVVDIDVAMELVVADEGSEISGVEIPEGSLVIAPSQKGDFGMVLLVTIPANELADLDLDDASMFYISDNGNISDVSAALSVNADDSVSVALSHASAYVITTADFTGDVDADEDWGKIDDDDDDDDDLIVDVANDANPHTGVTLAFGAIAASAAAVAITAKKRK